MPELPPSYLRRLTIDLQAPAGGVLAPAPVHICLSLRAPLLPVLPLGRCCRPAYPVHVCAVSGDTSCCTRPPPPNHHTYTHSSSSTTHPLPLPHPTPAGSDAVSSWQPLVRDEDSYGRFFEFPAVSPSVRGAWVGRQPAAADVAFSALPAAVAVPLVTLPWHAGRPYRHAWGAVARRPTNVANALAKFDLESQSCKAREAERGAATQLVGARAATGGVNVPVSSSRLAPAAGSPPPPPPMLLSAGLARTRRVGGRAHLCACP